MGLTLGKQRTSLEDFQSVLTRDSSDREALAGQGAALAALDRSADAVSALGKAIELGEDTPTVRMARAGALARMGENGGLSKITRWRSACGWTIPSRT